MNNLGEMLTSREGAFELISRMAQAMSFEVSKSEDLKMEKSSLKKEIDKLKKENEDLKNKINIINKEKNEVRDKLYEMAKKYEPEKVDPFYFL